MAGVITGKTVEKTSSALSADLLVIEGDVFRQVQDPNDPKRKFLVPVKIEAHVNPISILGGAAAGLLGVLAATVAWHGVSVPNPLGGGITLFKGLKETTLGADLNRAYERLAARRRIRASGGEVVESRTDLTPGEFQDIIIRNIGDTECQLLNREWATANRQGRPEDAVRFLQMAIDKGCPWVGQVRTLE